MRFILYIVQNVWLQSDHRSVAVADSADLSLLP